MEYVVEYQCIENGDTGYQSEKSFSTRQDAFRFVCDYAKQHGYGDEIYRMMWVIGERKL